MKYSALILALMALCGCARLGSTLPAFPQRTLCLGQQPVELTVEVATSSRQKSRGLMGRPTLAPSRGMLFVFDRDQPADHAFWMYHTLIPLDIAYLDRNGVILSIRKMEPCTERLRRNCPLYEAGAPYRYALEVNSGFLLDHQLGTGDRIDIKGADCPPLE